MRRLDRLGWAAGVSFECYGVRLGVRTNDPKILPQILDRLPYGARLSRRKNVDALYSLFVPKNARPGMKRYAILYSGPGRVARAFDVEEVLEALRTRLVSTVAFNSRDLVFVEGGVVELAGKAIVIAGPKASGKSRLVEALLDAGARFYSDRFALVDRRGRVHAYPVDGHPAEPGRRSAPLRPLVAALIVSTRFRRGARFRPRAVSPGEAVLELLSNTVPARMHSRRAIGRLRHLVRRAAAVKGVRGEAKEAVARIVSEVPRRSGRTRS